MQWHYRNVNLQIQHFETCNDDLSTFPLSHWRMTYLMPFKNGQILPSWDIVGLVYTLQDKWRVRNHILKADFS